MFFKYIFPVLTFSVDVLINNAGVSNAAHPTDPPQGSSYTGAGAGTGTSPAELFFVRLLVKKYR